MSGYIGTQPVPQATQTRQTFTATASQTSFATAGYTPGYIDVWMNGVKLVAGTDFTASNGSDVVLTSGAAAGDTVEVLAYSTFEVVDQDFTGDFSVDTNTLYVDSTNNRVGMGTSSPFSTSQILNTGWSSGAPYGTVLTVTGNNTNDANWGHLLISDSTTTTGNGGSLRFAVGATELDLSPHAGIDGYTEGANYGGLKFLTRPNGGTSTERMRIDSSGNVLMGNSTTPSAASANAPILLVSGPNDASIQLSRENATAGGGLIQSAAGPGLLFYTHTGAVGSESYTERMRIDSSGIVHIAKTTLTDNSGGLSINPASSEGGAEVYFRRANTTATTYACSFRNDSTLVGSIQYNNTSTSFVTSSDYRLKEDVQPMTGASNRVLALNPVNFAWKADGNRVDGFLAHEAQAVVPEAVTGEKDAVDDEGNPKYQGIDQSKLVPLLTAALQEALNEITDLKARVAALEGN